jgi:hypothetical protein
MGDGKGGRGVGVHSERQTCAVSTCARRHTCTRATRAPQSTIARAWGSLRHGKGTATETELESTEPGPRPTHSSTEPGPRPTHSNLAESGTGACRRNACAAPPRTPGRWQRAGVGTSATLAPPHGGPPQGPLPPPLPPPPPPTAATHRRPHRRPHVACRGGEQRPVVPKRLPSAPKVYQPSPRPRTTTARAQANTYSPSLTPCPTLRPCRSPKCTPPPSCAVAPGLRWTAFARLPHGPMGPRTGVRGRG